MTTKELTTTEPGAYLPSAQNADIIAALAENFGEGEVLSIRDLPSIHVPAGGSLTWEVPTADGMQDERTVTGVIIHKHPDRLFWETGMEEGSGTPPNCYSLDGEFGIGDPGGPCRTCIKNVFGPNGEAKECSEGVRIYLMQSGSAVPLTLRIPPGSLKPWRAFLKATAFVHRKPFFAVETTLALKKVPNKNNISYSQVVFTAGRALSEAELEVVHSEREKIMAAVSAPEPETVG